MATIEIQSPTFVQLLAMGDGLALSGQFGLAGQFYKRALALAPAESRMAVRARQGIAAVPNGRAIPLLKMQRDLEANGMENPFVADGMATWFKTLPFSNDERFLELVDKHAGLLPIANWHWNLQTVIWAVERARNVPGDFVELGVFKGHTTLFCAEYFNFQDWPKQWSLYDTFDGIPEDQQAPGWAEINERTYKGTYSFEEVRDRFAPYPNIRVIKGRVPEILQEDPPGAIAFLHIDLNNAPAEIDALEHLYDQVSPGGVIIFDDYCWYSTRVQHYAEKAWFAKRGLQILPMPTGQGLFIKP